MWHLCKRANTVHASVLCAVLIYKDKYYREHLHSFVL